MPSIWPQRRNPLEERILRRRRTPADALPGLGECNHLINDGLIDALEISDFSPLLNHQGDAFFAIPPGKSVASMAELFVGGNPEPVSGLTRYAWKFKPDGSRAWTWRTGSDPFSFRQYDISPAWSLLNTDWSTSSTIFIGGGNARDFEWSPDGTVLITSQRWFSSFYRLVAYDQSATPYDSTVLGAAVTYTNMPPGVFGIEFKPDGTEITIEHQAGLMQTRSLTIPFDITSIVAAPIAIFDSTVDAGSRSQATFAFSADGTKLYSITSTNLLCEWTLSTPYDISTAGSFVTGVNVNGNPAITTMSIPRGLFVRPSTGDLYLERDQGSPQRVKIFG